MSGGEAGDAEQGRPAAEHHLKEEGEGQHDDHHSKMMTSMIVRMSTIHRWRQCLKDLQENPTGRRSAGAH